MGKSGSGKAGTGKKNGTTTTGTASGPGVVRGVARGVGRGVARTNGAGFRWGQNVGRGVRQGTARQAYLRAYRRAGKHGHNPTVTGWFGRVAGGLAAAIPAWAARLMWNASKKAGRGSKLAAKKAKNKYTGTTAPVQPVQGVNPTAAPTATSGRWPTPTPAPQPAPVPVPQPASRTAPQPVPVRPTPAPAGTPSAGGRVGTSTAGGTMTAAFPPAAYAYDFYAAAGKFTPGSDSGAVWRLEAALPLVADSIHLFGNGFTKFVSNCQDDLQGGLKPHMRAALTEVFKPLKDACAAADGLVPAFKKAYADDLARQATRGGHTTNV